MNKQGFINTVGCTKFIKSVIWSVLNNHLNVGVAKRHDCLGRDCGRGGAGGHHRATSSQCQSWSTRVFGSHLYWPRLVFDQLKRLTLVHKLLKCYWTRDKQGSTREKRSGHKEYYDIKIINSVNFTKTTWGIIDSDVEKQTRVTSHIRIS